jgi:hypothetical protein
VSDFPRPIKLIVYIGGDQGEIYINWGCIPEKEFKFFIFFVVNLDLEKLPSLIIYSDQYDVEKTGSRAYLFTAMLNKSPENHHEVSAVSHCENLREFWAIAQIKTKLAHHKRWAAMLQVGSRATAVIQTSASASSRSCSTSASTHTCSRFGQVTPKFNRFLVCSTGRIPCVCDFETRAVTVQVGSRATAVIRDVSLSVLAQLLNINVHLQHTG